MTTGTQEAETEVKTKKVKAKGDKSTKAVKAAERPTEGKKAKAKGDKPAKTNGKAAKADKATKPAKGEKAAKGEKVAKEKKAAKPKAEKATVARDKFGFKEGSLKSQAAALYSNKKTKGATLNEIKAATGSSLLNLLKELTEKGYTVSKKKEAGTGKKQVTRYYITQ